MNTRLTRPRTSSLLVALVFLLTSNTPGIPAEPTVIPINLTNGWAALNIDGQPSLDAKLTVENGRLLFDYPRTEVRFLVNHAVSLMGLDELNITLRSETPGTFAVVVEDLDKARFYALKPIETTEVTALTFWPADFVLADDSPTRKEELDPLRLDKNLLFADVAAIGGGTGRNRVWISEVELEYFGVQNKPIPVTPADPEAAADTASAEIRSFRMGFTPFPYELSTEGVENVRTLVRENADILSVHFEGVPWQEAHNGEPFHPKILEDWQRHREARPEGGKVFLSLSPLNNGRSDLAGYRAEEENLPVPEPIAGKAFDDPVVVKAYLDYCQRAVDYWDPDYLAIGIEVNELFHNGRAKWASYTNLHAQVYTALKKEHPDLPICVTHTLHNMLNPDWQDREEMVAAVKQLLPWNDLVAISFYPFMAMLGDRMEENLEWLKSEFASFGKPFAFSETGQPAEPVVLPSLNFTIPADPERQRNVLQHLLSFSRAQDVEFLIWYLPRDYDALWNQIKGGAPEFFGVWRDCGLWDGNGDARPARAVWREFFDRRLKQE